jgi:hypothetical protein
VVGADLGRERPDLGELDFAPQPQRTPVTYLLVFWRHDFPEDPVWLFSELDDERSEVRKVEVYRDGHHGFADGSTSTGITEQGVESTPPLSEINARPQYQAREISQAEFEAIWEKRHTRIPPALLPPIPAPKPKGVK